MQPTDTALRDAVVAAARAGHLDPELARRALAVLAHAAPGGGGASLRAAGLPSAVVDWLIDRAAHASTHAGTPVPGAPGSSSSKLSSSVFLRQPPPGTRVGAFTVEGELGRGGMGVVLRARDDAGRAVALKLVLSARETSHKRFSREVAALAALDHPNVVRYLGSGDEPTPWLAMELVPGEDLKAILERVGRLSPEVSARLVAGVARGIAHAHEHGIIHRDLKPSNVLVRTGGEAVVTDFGLARDLEASRFTQTGAMLGTLATMAPEQVRGEKAGPPADVWALGVMLYVCLTGRSPFDEGDTALALTAAIVHQRIPSPRAHDPAIPEDLDATCRACLERDPARRPTARQVAQALRARRAIGAGPGARRRRGPALGAATLGGALLVIGAGVALTLGAPDGPGPTTPPTGSSAAAEAPPPWGPPGDGWALAWSSRSGPAPELEAAALWEEPGRVAAPLDAVLEDRPGARSVGLLGRTRGLDGGRLAVAYDHGGLSPTLQTPAKYVQAADAPYAWSAPLDDPPGGALLRAVNDASAGTTWIGAARWREVGVSLRWRRHEPVDGDDLYVTLGLGSDVRPGLWFSGRRGRIEHAGASAPLGAIDAWRQVRFAPGAAPGQRVVVDGAALPALDAAAAPPAGPGRVALELSEASIEVADVEVEGVLLRPDRPALAWTPGALPTTARVAAAFEGAPGEGGGPVIALGAPDAARYTLELDGPTLRLRRGDRLLASAPASGAAGHLVLERLPGDLVRGRLVVGERQVELEAADPLPLAASPLRAAWGSTAPRVAFTRVEAHAGATGDPARAALDVAAMSGRAAALAALDEHAADDATWRWRRGALLLASVSDPEWFDPALVGRARLEARRPVAAEAADLLAAAVDRGLQGPSAADALARAILARAVACDAAGAALAATRAVEALGLDAARARFDALERRVNGVAGSQEVERGALLERFTEGYYSVFEVAGRDAALAAAEVLVPEQLGTVLAHRASSARSRGLDPRTGSGRAIYEQAAAMFERARAAGADPEVVDGPYADLLMDLGRYADALACWERARVHSAGHWWTWARRGSCLQALQRRPDALESFLGALACAPTRRDVHGLVVNALEAGAPPGLSAAAILALADARAIEPDQARESALAAARAAAAIDGRDGDLARYVLTRLEAGDAALATSSRPTAVLARARAGAADARDALPAAAAEDALVLHLASLDPALRTLLGR